MSEMIKYKDRSIILGTCQNLYYATYADLKNNAEHFTKLAGSLSVEGYLNEKTGVGIGSRSPTKNPISETIHPMIAGLW